MKTNVLFEQLQWGARLVSLLPAVWLAFPVVAGPPEVSLIVQADRPGAKISPTMWGVFFEDINFGGDGGLYAELVKNRSFEFPDPLMGWSLIEPGQAGSIAVSSQAPLSGRNPHFLRVSPASNPIALINEGFRGMGVRRGESYRFSVHTRAAEGGPFSLRIELVTADGRSLARTKLSGIAGDWKQRTATLRAAATEAKARLKVSVEGQGKLDLDMISLFPRDTWKNRSNGLRADLVQRLKDLQPGFVRFPGGCIVEGRDLNTRYQWKNTIGDPAERTLIINRWNTEFKHRPTPDYFQSFGLGFFEYFLLCEDIGAEPLPILNCGMACQFNTGQLVPLDQLDPYIQDALDLIEFANGPATSPWGARRAQMGHPLPFNLKLLGVGNEQWGPEYIERYTRFTQVLKQRYPDVTLISSAGPSPADDRFNFAWGKLRELKADVVDEHCYANPDWFFTSYSRYDKYDRHGPKVFMGEYAAQSVATCSPENRNNWECALAEAAFMTGLERNADVVTLSSYAPLFGHEEAWQWRPNLIWFDNLQSYGTPNYYVQQLFSRNRGDAVLPIQLADSRPLPAAVAASPPPLPRLFAAASNEEKTGRVIIKVVNPAAVSVEAVLQIRGVALSSRGAEAITLASANPADQNTLAEPARVAPIRSRLAEAGGEFPYRFAPGSLTVLRLNIAKK